MKTIILGYSILLFLISYTVYILQLYLNPFHLDVIQLKQWNYLNIGGLLVAICVFEKVSCDNWICKQFLNVAWGILFFTILIIILNCNSLFTDPYKIILTVDISTFFVTLFILIAGGRHAYFKTQHEND